MQMSETIKIYFDIVIQIILVIRSKKVNIALLHRSFFCYYVEKNKFVLNKLQKHLREYIHVPLFSQCVSMIKLKVGRIPGHPKLQLYKIVEIILPIF